MRRAERTNQGPGSIAIRRVPRPISGDREVGVRGSQSVWLEQSQEAVLQVMTQRGGHRGRTECQRSECIDRQRALTRRGIATRQGQGVGGIRGQAEEKGTRGLEGARAGPGVGAAVDAVLQEDAPVAGGEGQVRVAHLRQGQRGVGSLSCGERGAAADTAAACRLRGRAGAASECPAGWCRRIGPACQRIRGRRVAFSPQLSR